MLIGFIAIVIILCIFKGRKSNFIFKSQADRDYKKINRFFNKYGTTEGFVEKIMKGKRLNKKLFKLDHNDVTINELQLINNSLFVEKVARLVDTGFIIDKNKVTHPEQDLTKPDLVNITYPENLDQV